MGKRRRKSRKGATKERQKGGQAGPEQSRRETLSKINKGFREQEPGQIPEPTAQEGRYQCPRGRWANRSSGLRRLKHPIPSGILAFGVTSTATTVIKRRTASH
ncbi:hypothetical protein DY000_02016136 [Brassica cretica]|uniref:Uncharacterized protein n=1 Tax=Brassica cretica TaxID=69181 RepID=A0ABQ7D7I8_BRACR|nr:hypothetical protein DY000_02016136 [Brassica cretica]